MLVNCDTAGDKIWSVSRNGEDSDGSSYIKDLNKGEYNGVYCMGKWKEHIWLVYLIAVKSTVLDFSAKRMQLFCMKCKPYLVDI